MLFVGLVAQDSEFGKLCIYCRRKVGIEPPREARFFWTIKRWKAGEGPVKKSRDVDSDLYHAYAIVVKFELGHKRTRSSLESSLVLSSLNWIFYWCDLITNVQPTDFRCNRGTAPTIKVVICDIHLLPCA